MVHSNDVAKKIGPTLTHRSKSCADESAESSWDSSSARENPGSSSALNKPVCLVALISVLICRTLLKVHIIVMGVVRRVAVQSPND